MANDRWRIVCQRPPGPAHGRPPTSRTRPSQLAMAERIGGCPPAGGRGCVASGYSDAISGHLRSCELPRSRTARWVHKRPSRPTRALRPIWLNGNLPTRLGDDPEDITRRVAATSAPAAADNRTDLPGGQKPARRQAANPLPRDKLGAARSPAMERPQITRSTAKRSAWRSRTSGRRSRPCVPSRHGGAPRRFARRAEPGR